MDVRDPDPSDPTPASLSWSQAGIEGVVGIVLMAGILIIMGLGVFYRYVLNDSLSWSEEISRYGLVYVTFIGCAAATRRRSHIRVGLLELLLPKNAAAFLGVFQDVATLAFVAYIAVKAFEISDILGDTPSAAMQIPMSYVYAGIVVGFGLAALYQIVVLARRIRS